MREYSEKHNACGLKEKRILTISTIVYKVLHSSSCDPRGLNSIVRIVFTNYHFYASISHDKTAGENPQRGLFDIGLPS